ncbi:DDE superfamily endonuclease [Popillia japonica]|uniref:DDE superfamily endonuclease n=1 Tax=Popillia japonica TaxID=7064 RepID=A0AAW1ID37_POPJA
MCVRSFDELLNLISEKITKKDTNTRLSISSAERLVITLRYLATGSTFPTMEYEFQVARSTIPYIVRQTCQALWEVLQPIEMPNPTEEHLLKIAEEFYTRRSYGREGDEAFGLAEHLLRPSPRQNLNISQRVFNYRLTRARRYVECTFGILANKWRMFHSTMLVSENFAGDITKAACVLHNFVRRRDGYNFGDSLTNPIRGLDARGTGGPSTGIAIRKRFEEYFMNEGSVPWQYDKI